MKTKWNKLFTFLGITEVQSSADGVFMKEEDVDKFAEFENTHNDLKAENDTLKAKVSELENSISAKDSELTEKVNSIAAEKESEISTLKTSVADLQKNLETKEHELAVALGKETPAPGKKDPSLTSSKKKLTGNELAAAKNAAALMGQSFDEDEE